MAAASGTNPPAMLSTRSTQGIVSYTVQPGTVAVADGGPQCPKPSPRVMKYSADGTMFAWGNPEGVTVCDAQSGATLCTLDRKRVVEVVFSPQSTFVATWENYQIKKGADPSAQHDNLFVFNTKTGDKIASWVCKRHEDWAPQWTDDDQMCAKGVSNEVQFFNAHDFAAGPQHRLKLQKLGKFKIAPGPAPVKIAVFVPGQKGAPGSVRVYVGPPFAAAVCNKSFYKADKVTIMWNPQGTAALVSTQTEVDKTGQSYYGETNLYYLAADGLSSQVFLDKKGSIYDCDWNPNGREFAVVYGFMPAKVALFDKKCDKIFDFGTGPRSMVKFSPKGNIVCFGGFGNLRGEVQFWDRKKLKLIHQFQASDSTYFEWCPDSRHILTATTSPRLKVDNNFKIWHYTKGLVHQQDFQELWGVTWRPCSPASYSDRPISPVPKEVVKAAAEAKKVYRPPGARGTVSKIKLHEDPPAGAAGGPPAKLSKAALKNKKKREAKKKAQEQSKLEGAKAQPAKAAPAAAAAAPQASGPAAPQATDAEKRIRSLNKKLRQMDQLKERQAAGETLQDNQLDKLKTEGAVRQELAELEKSLQ